MAASFSDDYAPPVVDSHASGAGQHDAKYDDSPGPSSSSAAPSSGSLDLLRGALMIAGLGCYVFAVGRHYTFYRLSPSQVGLGLTCGMALFGEALITQYFAQAYALSFWLYHVQEFTGFAVISYTVLGAYRRGLSDEPLLESLLLPGTRARLQAGYAEAMDSLVEPLSHGQQLTPALRQALRARFGLAESQMRVLEDAATRDIDPRRI